MYISEQRVSLIFMQQASQEIMRPESDLKNLRLVHEFVFQMTFFTYMDVRQTAVS